MKNFQTVQAEAAKEATVARATIAQQQDELSALQSKFELLQLSKDELQKSARTAVLGLQDRASEAQRLRAVTVLALDTTKDELQSLHKDHNVVKQQVAEHKATALLATDNLEQLLKIHTESESEADRLLDENFKLRIDARAADEEYEEQEDYISQVEAFQMQLQFKANGLQGILNYLMATYMLLQEEV